MVHMRASVSGLYGEQGYEKRSNKKHNDGKWNAPYMYNPVL
jgi:hypothetical protein